MKSRTKLLTSIIAITLSVLLLFTVIMIDNNAGKTNSLSANSRTIELSDLSVDTQNVFNEFENVSLRQEGSITYFSGTKMVDRVSSSEIDYINEDNIESEETELSFEISYDEENANVVLNVILIDENEETIVLDGIQGLAMDGEDESVDVWYIIDDEVVSADEILALEYESLDNIGLFSWIKKVVNTVVNVVVSVVVSTLVDAVTVAAAVVEFAANYGNVCSSMATAIRIESNYSHNLIQTFEVAENGNQKGFINSQSSSNFGSWLYGNGYTLDEKGCAIIATYNVLLNYKKITNTSSNKGNTDELAKIVKNYEYAFGTILGGLVGTNPLHIAPYLQTCGLSVTTYEYSNQSLFVKKCNSMTTSKIAIICYFWKKNGSIGMHNIAIKKNSSNELYLINAGDSNTYSNINDFICNNTFVYGWI